ncbi:MAG TPA: nuclear transport factor 2 family protein [Intrasporangium sp.]|uniref:nuclear transport factor 2 family protein n=1 Tax=Intrasporangium sp. TaxID=1925024 RepID=UPI002F91E6D8
MTTKRGAQTPRDLLAAYVERVAAGDVAGIVGSYAADAVVTLPSGREAAGPEAIGVAFGAVVGSGVALPVDDSVVDAARVIETGSLSMVSFTGLDGAVRTMVAWRGQEGWAWVRDGSMLRDVEAALGTRLVDVA